jgi:hypothetical protein
VLVLDEVLLKVKAVAQEKPSKAAYAIWHTKNFRKIYHLADVSILAAF